MLILRELKFCPLSMRQQFDRMFNEALLHKNENNKIDDRYRNVFETLGRLTAK